MSCEKRPATRVRVDAVWARPQQTAPCTQRQFAPWSHEPHLRSTISTKKGRRRSVPMYWKSQSTKTDQNCPPSSPSVKHTTGGLTRPAKGEMVLPFRRVRSVLNLGTEVRSNAQT